MSDLIFYTNGEETYRIPFPTPGTKCPEMKLEIKMTETDISKVLIEGDYATIMGVKYKRVEEPKKPETLYGVIAQWMLDTHTDNIDWDVPTCVDDLVDRIEKEWLPKEHDTNSYKWNQCLKLMREKLR